MGDADHQDTHADPHQRRRRAGFPTMEVPGHAEVTPSSPVPLDRPPPPQWSLALRPFLATRWDDYAAGWKGEDKFGRKSSER